MDGRSNIHIPPFLKSGVLVLLVLREVLKLSSKVISRNWPGNRVLPFFWGVQEGSGMVEGP